MLAIITAKNEAHNPFDGAVCGDHEVVKVIARIARIRIAREPNGTVRFKM